MPKFTNTINRSIQNILNDTLNGAFPVFIGNPEDSLVGEGVSVFLDQDRSTSTQPKFKNIISLSPSATILVKKKDFSSLKNLNDLQWMDRTEKMYLRSVKALFAYKVQQIRAYESLTKFETFFTQYQQVNLNLFAELLHQAQFLTVSTNNVSQNNFVDQAIGQLSSAVSATLADLAYDAIKEDVLEIIKRNAFSNDNFLTTWIVDPDNVDNFSTGPGTGVIEFTTFKSFNTTTDIGSAPKQASFTLEDPYRIMNIIEEDIEIAIEEALEGTLGLLSQLSNASVEGVALDTTSIVSSGLELLGLGALDDTIDVDKIRSNLRTFFLGKPIIDSPDLVHFFIRGNKSIQDFAQLESQIDRDDLSIDENILEAERILYTKKNIDFDTYKALRQFADNSLSMKHVWAGKVDRTTEQYNNSNGNWSTTVVCSDNMSWLSWSRYMQTPALQDPQGILEDPLTPYEITTDSQGRALTEGGLELLPENKELLQSGLLSYDSGLLSGRVATENNLLQGQYGSSGSLQNSKILQHPHGLVYRWKTGIITATLNVTVKDPKSSDEVSYKVFNENYGLTVAQDVLNNLDIANIISLLVVGQPYNVETFLEQALQAHNISNTSASSLSPADPLFAVLDVIRRQNTYFGNFKPYRMITMSGGTLEQTITSGILRSQSNDNIKILRERRNKIVNIIDDLKKQSGNGILIKNFEDELDRINAGVQKQIDLIISESGSIDSSDVLTSNFNLFGESRTLPLTGDFTADQEITRAMMIVGAQRRIEDVRLNRDDNLLIVSDQYDQNTDIRAYLLSLRDSNWKIFQGEYVDVYKKCVDASHFMNMEFFCNPEGHLELRPPQWNKTPLSVLNALLEIQQSTDIDIIPDFLTDLFNTRISSLKREIHSLNVRIVILALLLDKYPDRTLIPNISLSGEKALAFFGINQTTSSSRASIELKTSTASKTIGNLVDTGDQLLGSGIKLSASLGEDGDLLNGDTETTLGNFDPVFQETLPGISELLAGTLTISGGDGSLPASQIATVSNLNKIRRDFKRSYGIDPGANLASAGDSFQDKDFVKKITDVGDRITRIEKIINDLQTTISSRDKAVTALQINLAKQEELEEIESILDGEFSQEPEGPLAGVQQFFENTLNGVKTIKDIITGDVNQGTTFDHLIEDDRRNLLGPGSGKRFVIRDEDIISCTFTTQPPDFTRVDITGTAPFIGSALNNAFDNRYFWAGATDFDLWRQYGYIQYREEQLPFANNAELQCKPYAILLLQLQRVKINAASVTVVGNEYYRPGDVVYIPEKGLLYYVKSVTHDFAFGSAFTTKLELQFGHPPGQYLPSPLDIIGQQFALDPLFGDILVYRNQQGDDKYRALQPDCSILFPSNTDISEDNIATLLSYKENQVRFTNMMIDLSSTIIGNRVVLIRGFIKTSDDVEKSNVLDKMDIIKSLLQNPLQISQQDTQGLGDDLLDSIGGAVNSLGGNTGTTYGTSQMILPNGLIAAPISSEKIVMQLVILNKGDNTTEIVCFGPSLLGSQELGNRNISNEDVLDFFPKGGPKQRTWLDIRDDLTKIYNIIEVGILDVNDPITTTDAGDETLEVDLTSSLS